MARRDEKAYRACSTEKQRSPRGIHRRSNAAGLLPRAAGRKSAVEGRWVLRAALLCSMGLPVLGIFGPPSGRHAPSSGMRLTSSAFAVLQTDSAPPPMSANSPSVNGLCWSQDVAGRFASVVA